MKHHCTRVHTFLTLAILLFSLAFSLASVQPVSAQSGTWYVSTTGSDVYTCNTPESPCLTINGAIAKAAAGDTIQVAVGTYTSDAGNEVVLINKSISLSGGWDETFTVRSGTSIVDGEGARRGISINTAITVVIDHFTISNGLNNTTGGGIDNYQGTLTLNNSIVSGNVSHWMGGGINNYGTLIINYSIISGNSAGNGNVGGGGGGGIENYNGTVTLNNSTVSGNRLVGGYSGSGINTFGTVILNNSTVSGNTGGDGSGIYTFTGIVILNNSTVTRNRSRGVISTSGDITLQNTIIAGNGKGGDCYNDPSYDGTVTSLGYNLIGNSTGCSFTPTKGDRVGTSSKPIDPKLGPLQDNGGSTFTHALYTTSPALNAGNPAEPGSGGKACLPTDQRGVARPKGTTCDIGAYEGSVLKVIPTLFSPNDIITDRTPIFKWEKLDKATKYQYQLLKGTQVIYTETVAASACGATQCTNTPTTVLDPDTYHWKVRAWIGGMWKSYSPAMTFKLFPAKPGLWKGKGVEFYVLNTSPKVDNFAISIYVYGCGSYKITHTPLLAITNKKFSFKGNFYANGVFSTPKQANGTAGFNRFYIPGCGYVTGGPFSWSAVWKYTKQPAMTAEAEDGPSITLIPDLQLPGLQLPSDAFTVELVE